MYHGYYQNKSSFNHRRLKLRQEQTTSEKLLWLHLKNRQILEELFRRQYNIDYYIVDFYCHKLKLIIEVDGDIHDLKEVKEHDEKREIYLKRNNYHVIRFTNEQVLFELEKTLIEITNQIMKLQS